MIFSVSGALPQKFNNNIFIWVFPKIGVPQNGWFIMENSIKMDDLGGTTIFGNTHMHQIGFTVDCWQQNSINQFLEKKCVFNQNGARKNPCPFRKFNFRKNSPFEIPMKLVRLKQALFGRRPSLAQIRLPGSKALKIEHVLQKLHLCSSCQLNLEDQRSRQRQIRPKTPGTA